MPTKASPGGGGWPSSATGFERASAATVEQADVINGDTVGSNCWSWSVQEVTSRVAENLAETSEQ